MIGAAVATICWAATAYFVALFLQTGVPEGRTAVGQAALGLGVVGAFAAAATWASRAAASGVFLRGTTLVVRNPLSTVRVQIKEVDRAELRAEGVYHGIAVLVMCDGSEVRAWGIQAARSESASASRTVDHMNAFLSSARGASGRQEPPGSRAR